MIHERMRSDRSQNASQIKTWSQNSRLKLIRDNLLFWIGLRYTSTCKKQWPDKEHWPGRISDDIWLPKISC